MTDSDRDGVTDDVAVGDTVAVGRGIATSDTVSSEPSPDRDTTERRIRVSQPPAADYPALVVVDPAHYAIVREVARGGMGRIHAARDRRLGREVAVKEVLTADGAFVRRFEREARITARLQHPAIVSVYEAGVWPTGEPFYAMRLVTGRSLDEAIAAAPRFEDRLALLPSVLAVADAMAYAHGQRVIHRDLKPRNVVVGEYGETVVIDWGLAKELARADEVGASSLPGEPDTPATPMTSSASASDSANTVLGDVLGTPTYMPPEQAAGQPVDERADVYAIGAMLYQMLAGRPPYVAASAAEVLAALRAGPPEPVLTVAPNTPGELMAIIERAMAREPAARYATARELADDLRRFQTGQLVGAHRYSLRQLLARWVRRHRTALAALAAAIIAGAAIGVYAVVRVVEANRRVEQQRNLAEKHQRDSVDLMDFMLGDLREKLAIRYRLDLLDTVAQKAAAYYDARHDALTDEDIYLSATAHGTLAQVAKDHDQSDVERAELDKQRALLADLVARRPDVSKYQIAFAFADVHLAELTFTQGNLPGALMAVRAVEPSLEHILNAHPDDAEARHVLFGARSREAWILEQQGDVDGALAHYRALAELASAPAYTGAQAERDRLIVHGDIGRIFGPGRHDYRAALPEDRQTLAIAESTYRADSSNLLALSDVVTSHRTLAHTLLELNDLANARAEAEAALVLANRLVLVEPNDSDQNTLADARDDLGSVLFALHDYAGATAQYVAAKAIDAEVASKDPHDLHHQRELSLALNKLGDTRLAAKDSAGAIEWYRQALAIRQRLVAADPSNAQWHRDEFYSHYLMSSAYRAMPGHADDADAELRRALALAAEAVERNPTSNATLDDLAETHEELGKLLVTRHDLVGARAELHAALDMARRAATGTTATDDWRKLATKLEQELAAAGDKTGAAATP